jgi:4-hydroxybenzoate polyprenyltransferase
MRNQEKLELSFYAVLFLASVFLLFSGYNNRIISSLILGTTIFFLSIYYVISLQIIQDKLRDKFIYKNRSIFKWLGVIGGIIYIINGFL